MGAYPQSALYLGQPPRRTISAGSDLTTYLELASYIFLSLGLSMPLLARGHGRIYAALVVARVIFAFFGTGYIHPDEYFQNGEVVAG